MICTTAQVGLVTVRGRVLDPIGRSEPGWVSFLSPPLHAIENYLQTMYAQCKFPNYCTQHSEKASVEDMTWGQSVLATWNDEFAPLPGR